MQDFHTAKHNRDVELTDLLVELTRRYGNKFTKDELKKIHELTKPA